jgi:hypothetical protein
METNNVNIVIRQGQPFNMVVRVKDASGNSTNLSSFVFKSQIRKNPGLNSLLVADFVCSIDSVDNTKLNVSLVNTESLSPNCSLDNIKEGYKDMLRSELPKGLYYWSLRSFFNGNPVNRLIEGSVFVTPESTARL